MPLIPTTQTLKPKPKGRPKRKPGEASRGSVHIQDTPNPPTMPVEEPEAPNLSDVGITPKPRAGSLESRLAEAFAGIAIVPTFAGDGYSSFILATRSQKFAHDLAELAKVNPRIKSILTNLLDGGTYGGVIFSGAAMLLPILWGYGIIPGPGFDPFSALYPPVPNGVIPHTVKVAVRKSEGGRVAPTPSAGGTVRPPAGGASDGPPVGVVTVKPGMHPPVNPAAA